MVFIRTTTTDGELVVLTPEYRHRTDDTVLQLDFPDKTERIVINLSPDDINALKALI